MIRVITIGILISGTMLFLGTYEGFNLLYFEENIADKYALYGAIPIMIFFSFYLFMDKYKHSIKENRSVDATKHTVSGLIGIGAFYYFILVPVISGTITMTNDLIGTGETILVKGVVVDKLEINGGKLSEIELTVNTSTKTVTWDTNIIELNKYQVGDSFEMKMKKGFWGLLTVDK
jgi:hypothetical protein